MTYLNEKKSKHIIQFTIYLIHLLALRRSSGTPPCGPGLQKDHNSMATVVTIGTFKGLTFSPTWKKLKIRTNEKI